MYKFSAKELRDKFLRGEVSAESITEYFIKRIEKFDSQLGSFLCVLKERSLKKAKELDIKRKNGQKLGKLAGVPIAIKDNTHIKGELTTCGSMFLKNYRAVFNSTVSNLFEEEDAILIGKTNLDEFAMGSSNEKSAFFPVHNPWNLKCVSGGSSGGSSAAVSARLALGATGSDTGGSIRQPASFCGVVGFKPTYGRVSRYGLVAFGSSLDQIGPLATCTEDIGLIMEVIGKHCPKDSTSLKIPQEEFIGKGIDKQRFDDVKVGVPWHFLEDMDDANFKSFKESISRLKDLGAEIVDINLDILKHSIAIYYILATAEASTNLARFDGIRYGVRSEVAKTLNDIYDLSREDGFGPEVKKRIMLGTYVLSSGYEHAYYKKAQKVRTLVIRAFEEAFENCNLVAMPVSPSPAFEIGAIQDPIQMYFQDLFTICANLAGLPAISVPSGLSKDKKPIGLQLLGPQTQDVSVIRHAYAFEKFLNFNNLPPLFDKE